MGLSFPSWETESMAAEREIDDLLDELDGVLADGGPPAPAPTSPLHSGSLDDPIAAAGVGSSTQPPVSSSSPDPDSIIPSSSRSGTQTNTHPSSTNSTRCTHICLGGPSVPRGLSTASQRRSCDALRCVACDFRVVAFDDFAWTSRVDYLFVRNNAPDFEKLRKNLTRKKGSTAFACQCSWKTVSNIEVLPSGGSGGSGCVEDTQ